MPASLRSSKPKGRDTLKLFDPAAKALAARGGLLTLGSEPAQVTRNLKVEATWLSLLSDPPISHSDVNNWRPSADVRPSSFPFCPRRYVLERLGVQVPSTFNVESNYYTESGKAAHYVAQNALARTGRMWGLWMCARPTCKQRRSAKPSFYPEDKPCKACGASVYEYDELTLEDPAVKLRGHCDGVLVFKRHTALLEIKTAGDEKVRKLRDLSDEQVSLMFQTEAPWFGYHHQAAGCYASLVRQKYPELPPLREVIYLIFSRDSPKQLAAFTMPVPEDDSWWRDIRSRIVMAQMALAERVVPVGFAESQMDLAALPSCRWCTHKDVCLKPNGYARYAADALYDRSERERLDGVLQEEKSSMGSIIRGDVVETTEVLVPAPKPEPVVKDEDTEVTKKETPAKG